MVVSMLREKNMAFDFFEKRERERRQSKKSAAAATGARRVFTKGGAFAFVFLS